MASPLQGTPRKFAWRCIKMLRKNHICDYEEINLEGVEGIAELDSATEDISFPEGVNCRRHSSNPIRIVCRRGERRIRINVVDRTNPNRHRRGVEIEREEGVNTAPRWTSTIGGLSLSVSGTGTSETIPNIWSYVEDDETDSKDLNYDVEV